jgi:hypothetical protein
MNLSPLDNGWQPADRNFSDGVQPQSRDVIFFKKFVGAPKEFC